MDHDDLWPEGRLVRQLDILSRSPRAAGVLGHTLLFDKTEGPGRPVDCQSNRLVLAGLLQAGLFRRAAVEATGDFDSSLRAADDFDFLLRLIESGGRLEVDPDIAVFYRRHPSQWTADLTQTALQTARALRRSLHRRRTSGGDLPLSWRIDDEQTPN
jgi:GT2 family glycosyltransferase